jgi:putative GTP pyrophosphokinase
MEPQQTETWLDDVLPRHSRLTQAVITILEKVLTDNCIDYLAISGRTKEKKSALEKISRKGYKNPNEKLTDLTGIRVIVYFESDVKRVTDLIEQTFSVDALNSSNKDALLSINQIGYRSNHAVCDLGANRGLLPEFSGLSSLKFEIQIRTVLQHAWAELAHDRNYKFSGKLPHSVERQMYLYAGMLEIADKGFDELSKQIDHYISELTEKSRNGDLSFEVNSISLERFVLDWSRDSGFSIEVMSYKPEFSELVDELNQFGITTLAELKDIIPSRYVECARAIGYKTTIYGVIRDWMLINDWRKFLEKVSFSWVLNPEPPDIYEEIFSDEEFALFKKGFGPYIVFDDDDDRFDLEYDEG